jgi:AcrR family transcriptional regulator
MNASTTARARVRAELTREIKDAARRQLASEGAAALSLRAVARELGMASSALYRYFPSRDDLLTALIVEAYDALGEVAEAADAACPRDRITERWLAVCRAVRLWAVEHPHEYALIYGSPVPGYHAPPEATVPPATRVAAVLAGQLRDAAAIGTLHSTVQCPPLPDSVAADAARLRAMMTQGVPEDAAVRGLIAWTYLFGAVTFELFGHWENTVSDYTVFFEYTAEYMGRFVGFPPAS